MEKKPYDLKDLKVYCQAIHPIDLQKVFKSIFKAIPEPVPTSVIEDCVFICFRESGNGRFLHREDIDGRHIIILAEHLFENFINYEKIVSVIMHELAHYQLKHKQGDVDSGKMSHTEMEEKADELKDKWLEKWKKGGGINGG